MASDINTVLGPISPDSLGLTLIHEHIIAGYAGWECDPLARPFDLAKIVGVCRRALEPVKEFDVKTIVDATPIDLSRNIEVLQAVSEKLEINIICITGRYTESLGKWAYLKSRHHDKIDMLQEELLEGMMQEITEGIGDSGVKPGLIKAASGYGCISPVEEATLIAAARASRETGIPILTHTDGGTMGQEQADILIGAGADPAKIMIGHMCGNSSLQYQLGVLGKGVSIAFDRFGLERLLPDSVRTATLLELLGLGYADKIMLSHDFAASGFGRALPRPDENERKLLANRSMTNIFKNIIPALKKANVTDSQIETMLIDNPRRLLSGE